MPGDIEYARYTFHLNRNAVGKGFRHPSLIGSRMNSHYCNPDSPPPFDLPVAFVVRSYIRTNFLELLQPPIEQGKTDCRNVSG